MNPRWDESEFVFGDLQIAAQFIHHDNPFAARLFLEAACDTFAFPARNPGFGRYLIFYRELPDRIRIWRILHDARDLHQTLGGQ
jgi:plasmid stabilization system protein ParE